MIEYEIERLVRSLGLVSGEDASPLRDKAEDVARALSQPSPVLTPADITVWVLERMKRMMVDRGLSIQEILNLDWVVEVMPVRWAGEVLAFESEYCTMRTVFDLAARIEAGIVQVRPGGVVGEQRAARGVDIFRPRERQRPPR